MGGKVQGKRKIEHDTHLRPSIGGARIEEMGIDSNVYLWIQRLSSLWRCHDVLQDEKVGRLGKI
jgi:hypothetical protein